ncbi:MAG: nucleotidyltransferase domain-containing protein [Methylococcaceae bacterium]|nr:nucleotidyltransferase domain-containing protein [Methylococcaceae bacterium]
MIVLEKVKTLQTWLQNNDDIELAILFGSYAKDTQTIQSDLDLAITLTSGRSISAKQKLDYITEIGDFLLIDVDLIDLKHAGQPLLSQIIKYGKQLKGSQAHYTELVIKNINTGQDFLPYIERMMAERRERCLADG